MGSFSLRLILVGMSMGFSLPVMALQALSEAELSDIRGQALLNVRELAPNHIDNPMRSIAGNNIGFYRVGIQADMQINTNIRQLQLGCNGINGAGCDINIYNLALSGLPSNFDSGLGYIPSSSNNGNPLFTNEGGRAGTSATLKNPFFEIAIKNPDSASTRELAGIRFSAEEINGLLTAGTSNNAAPTLDDGIQTLSGFMRIAATTGTVDTKAALFGKADGLSPAFTLAQMQIGGRLGTTANSNCGFFDICRGYRSLPADAQTTGIKIPSMKNVPFTMPTFQVNGVRRADAIVDNVTTTLASIPIAMPTGCSGNWNASTPCSYWDSDQLRLQLTQDSNPINGSQNCIAFIVCHAKFKMGTGSQLSNLHMKIRFEQSLSMIHNIPLTGTGGYLSLQAVNLLWPDTYVDPSDVGKTSLSSMTASDIAQQGWWMSFKDAVQLGVLRGAEEVSIRDVLPQAAALVTQDLLANRIQINGGDIGDVLTNQPVVKSLNVNLDTYTSANPATLTLRNLQLQNQIPTANCYAGSLLTFC